MHYCISQFMVCKQFIVFYTSYIIIVKVFWTSVFDYSTTAVSINNDK